MYNHCQDETVIRKAERDGLISKSDYQRYLKINNSLQIFKKGLEQGALNKRMYNAAVDNTDRFDFVKVIEKGQMQFKLIITEGITSAEKDAIKKSLDALPVSSVIKKSGDTKPVTGQRITKSNRNYSVPEGVTRVVNSLVQMANEFAAKTRKNK